jgi:hypothetical protein
LAFMKGLAGMPHLWVFLKTARVCHTSRRSIAQNISSSTHGLSENQIGLGFSDGQSYRVIDY